ncbi:MAG: GNAT family N-acetyltransferase [Elusimicrobiota bacterium]
MKKDIIIKAIKYPTIKELNDIKRIYKEAGWWRDKDSIKKIESIVNKTHLFAVAILNGTIIGMARVISDQVSDAYIQDFAVLKRYRNIGIGTEILRFIIKFLKKNKFDWIGLIARKRAVSLYRKSGFKIYPDKIPMVYYGTKKN